MSIDLFLKQFIKINHLNKLKINFNLHNNKCKIGDKNRLILPICICTVFIIIINGYPTTFLSKYVNRRIESYERENRPKVELDFSRVISVPYIHVS